MQENERAKANGNGLNGNGNGRNGYRNGRSTIDVLPNIQTFTPADFRDNDNIIGINDNVETYEQTEIVTGSPEQMAAVEKAIHDLLDAFNVNWEDPNYTETPKRVAKAYLEYWVNGYARNAEDEITIFPNSSTSEDMVIVKDMRFHSLCSHHLAPIEGYGAIAYIPDKNLLGLSKLGRILDIYARRFQLQERIGQQTADAIMELLKPKGVMVILYNVTHGCMSSRGVKLHEANTTTFTSRGVFKDNPMLRSEVMNMLSTRNP